MRLCFHFNQPAHGNFLRRWFLFPSLLFAWCAGAQQVSLSVKEAPLVTVFNQIKKQTGYTFLYTSEEIRTARPVTAAFQNRSLHQALEIVFRDQPLRYSIDQTYVVIQPKPAEAVQKKWVEIRGRVVDETGLGIANVSVTHKGTQSGTSTGNDGAFRLKAESWPVLLQVTAVGFEPHMQNVSEEQVLIVLKTAVGKLDEQVVIAYGTTSKRLNTGAVSKLKGEEIDRQPVANPLAALIGRVPGLTVTQSTGVPGGSFKLQVRGQNSIAQGNDPLIVIDGVPLAANNTNINQVGAAFSFSGNGLSPFNAVNPADIESVEVLKDADATAIYGSRGANGVILITTKKGRIGKTRFETSVYTGFSQVGSSVDWLNTRQYLQMRREAFANDNAMPTNANAYDLLVWDTTRYTDLEKLLIGRTAPVVDAQASLSGGTGQTSFLVNAGYHREGTVYAADHSDQRGSMHFHLRHQSADNRFSLQLQGMYAMHKNNILSADLANLLNQPPNLPEFYDNDGNLKWSEGGFNFANPLSYLQLTYESKTDNLVGSLLLNYRFWNNLSVKASIGYNAMNTDEVSLRPITAQNPVLNPAGSSQFGNTALRATICEPQLEYKSAVFRGRLTVLLGGTWQQNTTNSIYLSANGYTNDALLRSTAGAGSVFSSTNIAQYRYAAFFGRVNYNWQERYLVNVTARRDGSSRFGPARQYATFGALGLGWIFTNDSTISSFLPFLSFGKMRGSFGLTGNDGIGDYKYLDTYTATTYPYQGVPGIYPTALFNPDYGWEKNKKWEAALELGFLKDRLLATVSYYRNRSSNQLVQYALPSQTGFNAVTKNLPAVVQNAGVEVELLVGIVKTKPVNWEIALNVAVPRNELIAYPDLANSTYRNVYSIGQPLTLGNGYRWLGVDPATGLYYFEDASGHSTTAPVNPTDLVKGLAVLAPDFLGGFKNSLRLGGFQLDCFFEFRKQVGYSYLRDITIPPGAMRNQPSIVLDRWQQPGDRADIQRFTTTVSNQAYQINSRIVTEGASNLYTDASYIRLKNVFVAYNLPDAWLKKVYISNARIYLQGQNLATITAYKVGDPETQRAFYLPPLRTVTAGIQLSF